MDAQEDVWRELTGDEIRFGAMPQRVRCVDCKGERLLHRATCRDTSRYEVPQELPAQPIADAQPETAQGERCALCGADKDDHYDDVQCPVGPDTWSSVYSFTPRKPEPSQQENAPQHSYTPEEAIRIVLEAFENSEADGYRSRDRQFAIDIFRHTAPSQPQPAESDGFEEKEILLPELPGKERFMLWIEYWRDVALPCRDAQLRTALVRAKAAEAKLESLLAQKPEAMVSDVDIAFITAVCDGGRVDKAINELLAYRQIFKDAEKGQGK